MFYLRLWKEVTNSATAWYQTLNYTSILRTFHIRTIGKAAGCHAHKDQSGLGEARPQLEGGTISLGGSYENGQLQDSTQYPFHEIMFPFLKPLLLF